MLYFLLMFRRIKEKARLFQTRFSFGMTSAIVTNLALIVGLDSTANAKVSIVASILVIALADNISDSLGIHIYQESEQLERKEIWFSTATNFLARLLVSLTFIFIIIWLPIATAVASSVAWGLLLLAGLSYIIARDEGGNPYLEILRHLGIAIAVIMASEWLGRLILIKS